MKKVTEPRERRRLVLSTISEFGIYCRNFLLRPDQASRLVSISQLEGRSPSQIEVVLLPGGERGAEVRLIQEIDRWRERWGGIGIERVQEQELLGGMPVRKARLLADYDKKMESIGISIFSQSAAKDWIERLSGQDSQLLLDAINERKKAHKIILKNLQPDINL